MPFTPTTWVDGTTAITATQLNRIETGVVDAHANDFVTEAKIADGAVTAAKIAAGAVAAKRAAELTTTVAAAPVGTILMARHSGINELLMGATVPGSELTPSGATGLAQTGTPAPPGTWSLLGYIADSIAAETRTSLWVRIS